MLRRVHNCGEFFVRALPSNTFETYRRVTQQYCELIPRPRLTIRIFRFGVSIPTKLRFKWGLTFAVVSKTGLLSAEKELRRAD